YVVLLKRIAMDDEQHTFTNNVITLRFISAIVFLTAGCFLVWLIPMYSTEVKIGVVVVAANFFFITMNQLLMGIYQHHLATQRIALAEILGKTMLFGLTLFVVYVWHGGLYAVLLTLVLSGAVNFGLLWVGLKRFGGIKLTFNFAIWKKIILESWPIAVAVALNVVYFKADTIILSLFKPADVGTYGFPYKILEVIITLPAILVGLLMPKLSTEYLKHNLTRFRELYQRSFYALCMLAMPMMVGAAIIAHPLMDSIVTKPELRARIGDLGNLLQILMLAVGMIFLGTLSGYVVVIVNKQRQIIWGYLFVAVIALIGYLYFIPRYSYYGAAWMTVCSETLMMLISTVIIYRASGAAPSLKSIWRVVLASLIMGGALLAVRALPLIVLIMLGGIFYVLALVLVKGVSKADLILLFSRKAKE
ncbi:MAG: polysaccharide biosynthesis C-terminal domain-containing protein, partial [Patescibacteria group bacterium]